MMDFAQYMAQGVAQEMATKAALTAAVVALVMLAARVFGRKVAGLLTGLPIITAPALVWVAVEQGAAAGARLAVGSVAACSVAAVFCLCYDRMARKAAPVACLVVAAVSVGVAFLAARVWLEGLFLACAVAALLCGWVLHCLREAAGTMLPRTELRRSNLSVTVAFAAVSGALVTRGQVDPFWVGLLAGLPIVAATVTVAEHTGTGALAVRRFLRGYVAGLIGKAAFGALFALLLVPAGLTWALLVSSLASVVVCAFGATRIGLPRVASLVMRLLKALASCAVICAAAPVQAHDVAAPVTWRLQARIVAVGMPGVAGVRQVGRFNAGGPIPGNPEFLLQTDSGRVLDPQRLLVAVASNYGAPLGSAAYRPGAILSIDPRGTRTLIVPATFAATGAQVRLPGGAVQLYSAQSPGFLNERFNGGARTAGQAAAAGPRYISINNAFGRPWIANAPLGIDGAGSVSVVDPDGAPLDNAPSDDAGGVFAGRETARRQVPKGYASTLLGKALNYRASGQLTPGDLSHGALGTAFLGASPDGTGFAVFAVATADGAISQVHVQDGVDGLAPPGTVGRSDDDGGVIGMAFQWDPDRVLFVADAQHNRLLLLHLSDDERQFTVARRTTITAPQFNEPVDLAPAVPEGGNAAFASHTTFAGSSDLYVVNRGDGSLLRLDQRGEVLARAQIEMPGGSVVGANRLRAIAVSADGQRLWLTMQGELPGFEGHAGALIEVSAFDRAGPYGGMKASAPPVPSQALVTVGAQVFQQVFTPETGLGPLFNEQSCAACHPGPGGSSGLADHFARRVARMDDVTGRVTLVEHPNSPMARRRSTLELGHADAPAAVLPRQANIVSLRMPLALFASSAIDRVDDAAIEAQAVSKGDGIKGRVNYVTGADGQTHVGRWGWKADIAALNEMVADAFANELGVTSALAVRPQANAKDDGRLVRSVSAYLRTLAMPAAIAASAP